MKTRKEEGEHKTLSCPARRLRGAIILEGC